MKIGLSYSRCLVDIYEKKVDLDDVIVIISRTDFDVDNNEHWENVWWGYTKYSSAWNAVWSTYKDKETEFRDLTREIRDEGKLHQPRQFGGFPPRAHHSWMEVILTDEDHARLPAAQKAWENYQLIAGLS